MPHRNAPLTETGRLRLARCVVDDGWPLRRAAERFQVSPTTAKRWADRYRALGEAGMSDLSSRPHRSPRRTPSRTERRIIKLRVLRRWGPARIAYLLRLNPATVHRVLTSSRRGGEGRRDSFPGSWPMPGQSADARTRSWPNRSAESTPTSAAPTAHAGCPRNSAKPGRRSTTNGSPGSRGRTPSPVSACAEESAPPSPTPDAQTVPDLFQRDFTATEPGRKYIGDITYLPLADGEFLYLTTRAGRLQPQGRGLDDRRPHAHRPGRRRAADGSRDPRRLGWGCVPLRPQGAIRVQGLHRPVFRPGRHPLDYNTRRAKGHPSPNEYERRHHTAKLTLAV